MAILTKDEILNSLKSRLGDDTSDEAIKFVEDFTDTLNDYETKTKDNTDWQKKYKDNDAEWRKKYKERFFESSVKEDTPSPSLDDDDDDDEKDKKLTYENLFKEETK